MSRSSFLSFVGGIPCAVVLVLWCTCIEVPLFAAGVGYIGHAMFWAMLTNSLGVSCGGRMLTCHLVNTFMITVWVALGAYPVRKQSIFKL